jgi:xanthine dehydrogenase accessory factor
VEQVLTSIDLAGAGAGGSSFIVVATQGHYDELALERALATGAAYVGLVASRKRAETVLGYLRDRGVPEDDLARVHAPAGLDLGHLGHEEIAVSILAELVRLRAAGELPVGATAEPTTEVHEAVDSVCGMAVDVSTARHWSVFDGRTYYFCSAGCRKTFDADPAVHARAGG